MDVHPIPQNVTSFQFKLIGDMTLKQFAYLATGCGLAYLVFVIFVPSYPFVAWPLLLTFAGLGAAFAFLPIGSRPLDYWVKAFLRAVYSPTKRVWKKNNTGFKDNPLFNSRLTVYLTGVTPNITAPIKVQQAETKPPPDDALPTQEELKKTVDLARQAQQLQMRIIQAERTLSQIRAEAQKSTPIPIDYSQQMVKSVGDLQNLVVQASAIKQQIQTIQEPESAVEKAIPQPVTREKIKVIVPVKPQATQVALTTFPNVISGIVNDKQNNYLAGVVAVIYDKEGLPVRALKTNKLGQFTGSTPLPNGIYNLELEKDNYSFDVLQIELVGEVLPALMITAKE